MLQELDYLLLHLELLYTMAGAYHREVQDRELMASGALRASDITKVRTAPRHLGAFSNAPNPHSGLAQMAPFAQACTSSWSKLQKFISAKSWDCPWHADTFIAPLLSGCQLPWTVPSVLPAFLHSSFTQQSALAIPEVQLAHKGPSSFDFSFLSGSAVLQKDLAMLETRFLAEEEHRHRILSAQKVQTDWLWLKEASKKHSRAVSGWQLGQGSSSDHPPWVQAAQW